MSVVVIYCSEYKLQRFLKRVLETQKECMIMLTQPLFSSNSNTSA